MWEFYVMNMCDTFQNDSMKTAQYGLYSSTQVHLLIIRSLKYENSGEKYKVW